MEKGELERIPAERVARAIVLVRGQRVLLDRDLAVLYGVETRVLNQAVRRNIVRFPPDFLFMLTREEIRNISQIVTCSTIKHARSVSAFTEQGVAMLSRPQERAGDCGQYCYHAGVRAAARGDVLTEGPYHQARRSGGQDRRA
jgi:hypothetical protein